MDWVTATLGAVGAMTGLCGAIAGIASLVLQRRQAAAIERERRREEARTVTAQWITRTLDRPNSFGQTTEFGLWVRNHGRVPVHDVHIEATAKDAACTLPTLDSLQSGEMFIRKDSAASSTDFHVRRMGANVVSTDPILAPTWRVSRIAFRLDGQPVTWSAHSAQPTPCPPTLHSPGRGASTATYPAKRSTDEGARMGDETPGAAPLSTLGRRGATTRGV